MKGVKVKRHCMTLLELMIASSFTILLIMVVGYFYRQSMWLDSRAEQLQKKNFYMRYVETRLMQVLPNIERNYFYPANSKKGYYYFLSDSVLGDVALPGSANLLFIYRTNDLNPETSLRALGLLFVDKDHRLMLATWPSPEIWENHFPSKARFEVLLENVKDLKFAFFDPPARNRDKFREYVKPLPDEKGPGTTGAWLSEWKEEYHYLPPLVKVMVTYTPFFSESDEMLTYAFPLPNSTQFILYEQL